MESNIATFHYRPQRQTDEGEAVKQRAYRVLRLFIFSYTVKIKCRLQIAYF